MTMNLPTVIANYFAADRKGEAQATSECFTTDAVVIDEGNRYVGRDAIRQWMANASTQYSYTVEPFDVAQDDGHIVVTSHLVGNFPGSPVDLRYRFVLDGDQITQLVIVP
ncbi:nuclear transport factor 2 family protein [Sphingomonas suaedae]|uniref:Nuclear transport factor 2 family protein n=1 Tax=Sphingomonas suaedae TaxID=2599297 RepID=A0A518RC48_9SPHN|nr:nuclear transport factor 2 family protein [Sphingomonas suaedae]QDX25019.1 nuclear transport factor 2 family protein [Sphingomonas suaedae]